MNREKEELISVIGQLSSEVYDLKQNQGSENNNEYYENQIQSLNQSLMIEKESSKNKIESLYEEINTISAQNTLLQSELTKANTDVLRFQKLFEEQRSLNLTYKSMNSNTTQQDASNNSELLIEFEKISTENEELKKKIDDLTKTIQFNEEELQKQIQSNNTDRENFYAEIKRLTENSLPKMECDQSYSSYDYEIEKNRLTSENSQLRSNLANISSALQKTVKQNTQLANDLHLLEKKCSEKVRNALEESAQYKAIFTSLQSLFNTENKTDILYEVKNLYQNSKKIVDYEHMQTLLKAEMKKNEELRLMVHLGAKIPIIDGPQPLPSSPAPSKFENQPENDVFLLQERLAHLEAEKEDLSRMVNNSNKNCESLRHQLNQKDQIIEENQKTIKTLQDEADTLRGEILSHEEQISQSIKNESENKDQVNEDEMKKVLELVESLRQENDELRLMIGRKESGVDTISQNSNPSSNQESDLLIRSLKAQISQIQQKIIHVADALKLIEMPTPAFVSFTEFLEEKVIAQSTEESEITAFAEEAVSLAGQLNFDYRTLYLVQNQCVSAYDQMNKFFGDLKEISDKVENFYCSFDAIYESVGNHLNFDQANLYGMENYNGDENYDMQMGKTNIPPTADDFDGNGMHMPDFLEKKSPKIPNGNSSFISLLDSPKIYRNELLDQENNSDEEIKMNIDDLDEIPSLAIKDKTNKPFYQNRSQRQASSIASSSSSRIPKASGSKNSKSRIPLSSRQNVFDQKMLSPKQAPSHIPELQSKRKNKFA